MGYGNTVAYRRIGASEAAKLGAVGALVRSLTAFSLATPHTGIQVTVLLMNFVLELIFVCQTAEGCNKSRFDNCVQLIDI